MALLLGKLKWCCARSRSSRHVVACIEGTLFLQPLYDMQVATTTRDVDGLSAKLIIEVFAQQRRIACHEGLQGGKVACLERT